MAKIYAGLDIGSYEIKLVEVRKSGRQQIISQTAVVRTPMGSVERSQVLDVELVIDAVQSMLVESPLSTDKVVIGITSPEVVVKTVQMPLMPPKELEHALQFELPDIVRFPFESLKDITYSWEVLEKSERYQEILVVACRRSLIAPYIEIARRCKLELGVIDLPSFNIPRLFPNEQRVCVVDVGAVQTSVYVAEEGYYKVYRILPIGGQDITNGVMEAFSCDYETAERLKSQHHIDTLLTEGAGSKRLLRSAIQQFVGGILQTLEFLRAEDRLTNVRDAVSEVHLCGGTSLLKGFADVLTEELGVKVSEINPFSLYPLQQDGAELDGLGPIMVPALALALRGLEEK